MLTAAELKCLGEVSQGRREADLYIEGGNLINVYSGEIYPANIAIYGGRVAYVGSNRSMVGSDTSVIKANGYYLSPAYLDCHTHPWAIYNPVTLAAGVLPMGTTTLVCDDLLFFLLGGEKSVTKLIDWATNLPVDFYWTIRVIPQSPSIGEFELFTAATLQRLFAHPRVLAVAEITRWPLLVGGDKGLLELVEYARNRGLRIDGHTAGCTYERLNTLAPIVDSCHEAITAEEVAWRLRLGYWVMLRHSSLRPDLPELLRAVTEKSLDSSRLIMTTDGSSANFTEDFGFLDGMLRLAVKAGMDPVRALKMVTLNPATYMGLDKEKGGLAPGRRADILLLPNLESFRPDMVLSGGRVVAEGGRLSEQLPLPQWPEFELQPLGLTEEKVLAPELYGIPAEGPVDFPVIDFVSCVITKEIKLKIFPSDGLLKNNPDLLYCALLDRAGQWRSLGFLRGLGQIEALASTYNTSCHLLVVGENRSSMALAAARVVRMGGGITLVRDGKVVFELPLEIGGMMSDISFAEAAKAAKQQELEVKKDGYPYNDFLYSLLFLVGDFLPGLRLTPMGLIDVKAGKKLIPALRWK